MNDKLNQTGIENSTFGNDAQISIEQKIILPFVPKEIKENPHNLPNSGVAQFVGREDVLTQLHEQLQKGDRVAISTLTGMPGIGKSELALRYAWKEWPKQTYRGGICWLNIAESDPGLSILSFAQIHLGLTLPDEGELSDRVRFCWQHWLKNEQDQALIIFDDVRHYQQIKAYLPSQAEKRFKVIITTRNENLSATIQTLHLELLDEEPALALLRSYVTDGRIDQQLGQAKLLYRDLGYLPLALELVARLLKRRKNWTIQSIRERLAEKGLADQSLQKNPNFDAEMTAQNGVKAAFDLSWEALDSHAQQLAMYLSLFALAPFSKSLIDALLSEQDPEDLEEWLTDSLVNLNLVSNLGDDWYELHTLIRVYLWEKLEEFEVKETAKKAYCAVMVNVAKNIKQTLTLEDIAIIEPLIDHLKIAAEEFNQWLEDEDLIWPFVGLGRFYQSQGVYHQVVPYFEQCLTLSEQRLGKNHPTVATALNNLGFLYTSQGKYVKAESIFKQLFNIYRETIGENTIGFSIAVNNLAELYHCQGKYNEIENLHKDALRIKEEELGKESSVTATSLNNLASFYYSQGNYQKAEKNYEKAIEIWLKNAQKYNDIKDYLDAVTALEKLAELYRVQKHYNVAEMIYLKSLKIREKFQGTNSLEFARTMNNLAGLYQAQEKFDKAEILFLTSLEIRQEKLGKEHLDVAESLSNLAGFYQAKGNYGEAKTLSQQALTIFQQELGDHHSLTQNSLLATKMFNAQILLDCDTQTLLGILKAFAQQANLPYTETKLILLEMIATNPQLLQSLRQAF
ncbi:MAG: tetratricopeptide repeat protein [Snowella sp.]|nr:tetratricopeptide repeat protein [Snowella sp.]